MLIMWVFLETGTNGGAEQYYNRKENMQESLWTFK